MSVQYDSLSSPHLYLDAFGVDAPQVMPGAEIWPRRPGVFIRAKAQVDVALEVTGQAPDVPDVPDAPDLADLTEGQPVKGPEQALVLELVSGQLGLVPKWVKSASDAKLRSTKLVNARNETLTTATPFRAAWLAGQRCIVPMQSFQDDDFRNGKRLPTRFTRVDGRPMGVAALWECWTGADGETITSYALITVNANSHALMHRYQQPGAEKRMLAVLNEGSYAAWLQARPDKAKEFLRAYPANHLTANPIEKRGKTKE